MSEFIRAIGIYYKNELNAIKKVAPHFNQYMRLSQMHGNRLLRDFHRSICDMAKYEWNSTIQWDSFRMMQITAQLHWIKL